MAGEHPTRQLVQLGPCRLVPRRPRRDTLNDRAGLANHIGAGGHVHVAHATRASQRVPILHRRAPPLLNDPPIRDRDRNRDRRRDRTKARGGGTVGRMGTRPHASDDGDQAGARLYLQAQGVRHACAR